MMHFAFPWAWGLLVLPFVWRMTVPALKGLHGDALKVPFIGDLEKISIKSGALWQMSSLSNRKEFGLAFWLLYGIWVLLTAAAARPQWVGEPIRLPNQSRDIMLVLDISTSMLTPDFSYQGHQIDRLTAVKKTASDFIKKRANDRIGLILFGTRAYLQSPLTFDKSSVAEILWSMDAGMAGDSTSIGDALGTALKTLKQTPTNNNKVIVLLTDGENNDGSISLPQAIKLAEAEGIKTYTIGVGSRATFMGMFLGNAGVDEQGLKAIAKATEGQYFRAENTSGLQKIYNYIDQLEGQKQQSNFVRETKELYYIPLLAAIIACLAGAAALRRIKQ